MNEFMRAWSRTVRRVHELPGRARAHARTAEAYSGEAYRRLMAVKAAYDPDNALRFAFPIPPAVAG